MAYSFDRGWNAAANDHQRTRHVPLCGIVAMRTDRARRRSGSTCQPVAATAYSGGKIGCHDVRREMTIKPDTPDAIKSGAVVPTDGPVSEALSGDRLVASLYAELRVIARREHFRAGAPQTLQATALISEAYIKLQKRDDWSSKAHFLGCAATAIRHILIDAARARLASKRNAETESYTRSLDSLAAAVPHDDQLVSLGDALKQLSAMDANLAQVVDCRFFAGLDERETAEVLGVSDRTVRRWWVQARAWIYREMAEA
jgi:RNA polymerase sigma factor (TIGR02999 family)